MMIQCEGCDAWQHTQCMGIPKKKIPKQYFCEVCSPDRHVFLLEQMALGEKPWERKGGMRKRAPAKQKDVAAPAKQKEAAATPAKQKEAAATPAKQKETTPKQKAATKEPTPKQKQAAPKKKEATPARAKRVASTTAEKPKAAPVAPAPPTTTPRTTSRSRSATSKAATTASKVTAPPATPKAAAVPEKAAPASASPPATEPGESGQVVKEVKAPMSEEQSKEKNEDVPMEDVKPVNEDKMDIDEPEPKVPVVESSEEAFDRTDRDATTPAEDMPPPPAPPPPPPASVEAKPNKSLPPIVTDVARRPGNKREGSDTVMTPKTPKSAKRKSSADSDGEYKGDDDKVSKHFRFASLDKRELTYHGDSLSRRSSVGGQ